MFIAWNITLSHPAFPFSLPFLSQSILLFPSLTYKYSLPHSTSLTTPFHHCLLPLLSPTSLPTLFPNSFTQLCSLTHPTLPSHPTFFLHSLTNLSPFFFLLFHSTLSHTHSHPFSTLFHPHTALSLSSFTPLSHSLNTLSLKTTLIHLQESISLLSRRLFLPYSNPFYSIFSFYFLIPLTQPRTPHLFTLSHTFSLKDNKTPKNCINLASK